MSGDSKDDLNFVPRHEATTVFESDTFRITTSTSIREVPFPNMEGPIYLIEYQGKDDSVTKREIIVQWITSGKENVWVTAYCKLRNEVRKFNSAKIISMRDFQSGETIVDPTKHLRRLEKQGL